jgi:hypothetical protein
MTIKDDKSTCSRCRCTYERIPAGSGTRYGAKLLSEVTTTRRKLRFSRLWVNRESDTAMGQFKLFHTDLELCNDCAAALLLWAQGKEQKP